MKYVAMKVSGAVDGVIIVKQDADGPPLAASSLFPDIAFVDFVIWWLRLTNELRESQPIEIVNLAMLLIALYNVSP